MFLVTIIEGFGNWILFSKYQVLNLTTFCNYYFGFFKS